MKFPSLKVFAPSIIAVSLLVGCTKNDIVFQNNPEDYSSKTINSWGKLQLKLIQTTPGFTPPVASRALAYTNLAAYEAVVSGSKDFNSLAGQLNGLTAMPQPEPGKHFNLNIALSASMNQLLKSFYSNTPSSNIASIDNLYTSVINEESAFSNPATIKYSEEYGKKIADHIYNWSLTDGGKDGQLNNFPAVTMPTGPQYWVPGAPGEKPLLPFWGNNRTFVASNGALALPGPLAFSTAPASDIYKEHVEVYQTSKNLTADQKTIALFWADGSGTITPGGHSFSIALQLAESKDLTLMKAAELYAKTTLSVADAFICCWKTKYVHNTLRPWTYINNHIDPTWKPFLPTPPFPEHTSGHSSQSGASSAIFSAMFGAIPFTDHSHDALGFAPRSFTSFDALGVEAMNSRLYGGIHIKRGNEAGLQMGKEIAQNILKLKFRK